MSDLAPRTLRDRLVALVGLVAIVGVVLAALFLGGFFDSDGDAEAADLLDTPIPDGLEDLEVGPKAGELAPDFELSAFDGDRHRLSDFRGQVIYLNFWATWCVPCQAELPDIDRLQTEYGDQLAVIEVNRGQSTSTARDFFESVGTLDGGEGVDFTVNGLDPDETLYERYLTLPIQAMPISVIIDERGVVTELANGQLRYDDMKAAVDEALRAPGAFQICVSDETSEQGDHLDRAMAQLSAAMEVVTRHTYWTRNGRNGFGLDSPCPSDPAVRGAEFLNASGGLYPNTAPVVESLGRFEVAAFVISEEELEKYFSPETYPISVEAWMRSGDQPYAVLRGFYVTRAQLEDLEYLTRWLVVATGLAADPMSADVILRDEGLDSTD